MAKLITKAETKTRMLVPILLASHRMDTHTPKRTRTDGIDERNESGPARHTPSGPHARRYCLGVKESRLVMQASGWTMPP